MHTSQLTEGDNSSNTLLCSRCNTSLPSSAMFCASCGKRVEKKKADKKTHAESDNKDVQDGETTRLPSLIQLYLKHAQSYQLTKNKVTTIRPNAKSAPPVNDSSTETIVSSASKTGNETDFFHVHVQDKQPVVNEPSQSLVDTDTFSSAQTWQPIPVTEEPVLLQTLTPLPSISYVPIQSTSLDATISNLLCPLIIMLLAVATSLVTLVFTHTSLRPAIVFLFLCICPGMILVRFLHLKEPIVEWTLAIALSFSIDAIVGAIQLYTKIWSPQGTLNFLLCFCLLVTVAQLVVGAYAIGFEVYPVLKELSWTKIRSKIASFDFKRWEVLLLFFPLLALFLWTISLQTVSFNAMNNLGLISALSPRIIVALGILVISFVFTLQHRELRVSLLIFQFFCILLILYTTPNLIEEMPRFAPIYRSAGYTDFIMQTGTVAPNLDFYFNIPGFYVLSAFFTSVFGYSTILSYAGWAPILFTLIYAGPMYSIFASFTPNKRLVWLSLLFFYLTNWIGQDYFSPQGLNFFFYLVIIMILLKWFRMPPKHQALPGKDASLVQKVFAWLTASDALTPPIETWQRRALLCFLILIFGIVVFSHPLTPFFILLSVSLLVVVRRCYPFWLPILMLAMIAFWDIVVAGPYLSQHYNLLASLGNLLNNVPKSITTGKLSGDPLYHVISSMRLYMTALLWCVAFLGGINRLRQRERDVTLIVLALAAFPLIVAQNYGNEMLLRIYFFTEPFMCFFAASLFFANPITWKHRLISMKFPWRTGIIMIASLFLLGTFFFTRYGDERVDYVSNDEWSAVQYLYQVAPAHALVLAGWNYCPLYFKDYAKYNIEFLDSAYPDAVATTDTNGIIYLLEHESKHDSYIIFSQEEQALATSYSSLPDDILQRLETRLLQTGRFKLVYSNSDAQILQFVTDNKGGT